jgi:hypothetical protein
VQAPSSPARRSVPAASRTADAETDHEASDPREDEDTADAVPVLDSDKHRDPDSEQSKTGHKPESDEALPTLVDGRTVIRLRIVSPALRAASGVIPEHWPRRAPR